MKLTQQETPTAAEMLFRNIFPCPYAVNNKNLQKFYQETNLKFVTCLVENNGLKNCCDKIASRLKKARIITASEKHIIDSLDSTNSLEKLSLIFSICIACHEARGYEGFFVTLAQLFTEEFNAFIFVPEPDEEPTEQKRAHSEPSKRRTINGETKIVNPPHPRAKSEPGFLEELNNNKPSWQTWDHTPLVKPKFKTPPWVFWGPFPKNSIVSASPSDLYQSTFNCTL